MIRYALKCVDGHAFESWFASGDAFEALRSAREISCPFCGGTGVDKALMAPRVAPETPGDAGLKPPVPGAADDAPHAASATSPPDDPNLVHAIAKLRAHVENTSDDVGSRFAIEARRMHLGDVPQRAIHGQATPGEARDLVEDGIPVLPLPFTPTRTN